MCSTQTHSSEIIFTGYYIAKIDDITLFSSGGGDGALDLDCVEWEAYIFKRVHQSSSRSSWFLIWLLFWSSLQLLQHVDVPQSADEFAFVT